MKKNLVQKFRKFYFALPKDEQIALYDIMSAIRGEDEGSYKLKTYTTARIRGALFGKSQSDFARRGLCFASLKKAQVSDRKSWIGEEFELNIEEKFKKANEHFIDHIDLAIKALEKHGFKGTISDLGKFTSSNNFDLGINDDVVDPD